jgi:hypothetical protein
MPFETFKARVKIVRDEETVKKWVDDQSWKTDYVCLNMPEPLRLDTREGVEKHFREVHKDNIIKPVESHTLNGVAAQKQRSQELTRFLRFVWEEQRRFPLQIATVLSQQFASQGLQFFKVNKTLTHVSVARPHFLDLETTPVSEGVKRIVDFINAHPKSTRRKLVEALAPTPAAAPIPVTPPAQAEGERTGSEVPAQPVEAAGPTPEQTAVIADLHWLIHQGHVIEFANGTLETAKKPLPKPPKPEKKPSEPAAAEPAATEEAAAPVTTESETGSAAPNASVEGAQPEPQPENSTETTAESIDAPAAAPEPAVEKPS